MGGDRIKNLKDIVDDIFLSLQNKDYEKLPGLGKELQRIDLNSLSKEERVYLKNAINEIEKIAEISKESILKNLNDKEMLKKYKL